MEGATVADRVERVKERRDGRMGVCVGEVSDTLVLKAGWVGWGDIFLACVGFVLSCMVCWLVFSEKEELFVW